MLPRSNKIPFSLFLLSIIIITLFGLVSFPINDSIPSRLILEFFFFASGICVFFFSKNKLLPFQIIMIFYIFFMYLVMATFYYGKILDFLLIYKSHIYFIFIFGFVGNRYFRSGDLAKILKILILLFFCKYLLWKLLGVSDRPQMYGENNFELIFLLLLYIIVEFFEERIEKLYLFLLVLVFLMSGSRSGLAALIFVLTVVNFKKFDIKLFVGGIFLLILMVIIFNIFQSRLGSGGIDDIDRLRFFRYFLYDIRDWGVLNYLFGTAPITPMSNVTCSALASYDNLFSYHEAHVCYSVILHGYNVRMVYDHGLWGLFLAFYIVFYFLRSVGWSIRYTFAFLGTAFLTGLSISSLNNIFVVLGLAIAVSAYRGQGGSFLKN